MPRDATGTLSALPCLPWMGSQVLLLQLREHCQGAIEKGVIKISKELGKGNSIL